MECDKKPLLKAIKRLSFSFLIFLILNFTILGVNTYLTKKNVQLISMLDNKIELIKFYQQQVTNDVYSLIKTIAKTAIDNDTKQLNLTKGIIANIISMQGALEKIVERIKETHTIDLPNKEAILEANFKIINIAKGISGSGTHIKLRGISYILTCAHLIDNVEEEFLTAKDNKGYYFGMELIKIDRKKDLALFTIEGVNDYPYLEISDIAPTEGSEIIVIGNPDGMMDVISDGVVAKVEKNGYIVTNIIFFGSSGGAVLYKGKIVGVISKLMNFFFINYSYTVKLETIKEFLKDYNVKK